MTVIDVLALSDRLTAVSCEKYDLEEEVIGLKRGLMNNPTEALYLDMLREKMTALRSKRLEFRNTRRELREAARINRALNPRKEIKIETEI